MSKLSYRKYLAFHRHYATGAYSLKQQLHFARN